MKVHDILTEGPMDYMRGMGQEAANKMRNIAQPFKDIHQAGQQTSMEADIMKLVLQLANSIQKYRSLKKQVNPVKEGVMDYMRGAGTELANKATNIIQPFKDMHQAGKQKSQEADLNKYEQLSKTQLTQLVRLLNRYGPNSYPIVKKAFNKYNIPPGIRAAIANKLKKLVDQIDNSNSEPKQRPSQRQQKPQQHQQEPQSNREQFSGPGIQARTPGVYKR